MFEWLTVDFTSGLAEFTDVYIRHAGAGYRFRYEYDGILVESAPFTVLPAPPRVIGAYFSPTFTGLVVKFDAETNQADMIDSIQCGTVFSGSALAKLGQGATCSWSDPYTLDVVLGNNARVVPEDALQLGANAKIYSRIFFSQLQQTDGTGDGSRKKHRVDQRCADLDSWALEIRSPLMHVPACVQVGRPQRLSAALASPSINVDDDVSFSDVEFFLVDGKQYMLVLKRCKGIGCLFLTTLRGPLQHNDLDSNIYRWHDDGKMTLHQALPTQGATDVEHYFFSDALESGGKEGNNFLVVANAVPDRVDTRSSITLFTRETLGDRGDIFTLRQKITNYIDMPMTVKVKYHEYSVIRSGSGVQAERSLLLVVANAGQMNAISIFKWVPGSFRAQGDNGWVAGAYDDTRDVQLIPAKRALSLELYHIGTDLYLAVANSREAGSYRTPVMIYKWIRDVACSSADKMCFIPQLEVAAVGARSVTHFALVGAGGLVRNFMAVANQLEGDQTTDVSSHYVVDAYIYEMDYATKTSNFFQALQSYCANKITAFQRCENNICESFLAVANLRGICGPESFIPSRIYKWSSTSSSQCAHAQPGKFHLVYEMSTKAALRLQYLEAHGNFYLMQLTGGSTGVLFHEFESLIPVPEPVVDYASSVGPCDTLRLDARASLQSGGRDFIDISWTLVGNLPEAWQVARPGMLPYAIAKLHQIKSAVVDIDSACPSGLYIDPVTNYSCINSVSLPPGRYQVRLSMSNWIGGSAQTEVIFQKDLEPVPIAKIVGPSAITSYFDKEVVFEGQGKKSPCSTSDPTLFHSWTLQPPVVGAQLVTHKSTLTIP